MPGSTTVINHAGSTPAGTSQNGFALGPNGNGRADPPKGKRQLPHIDDITSVAVSIEPVVPIDKVIQTAELYLSQAESSRTFGRPDIALADYIRANLIVINVIKHNRGWVSLQNDNKAQYERYQRLLRQVSALLDSYEKIKADIKADNQRTGVQPAVRRSTVGGGGSGVSAGSTHDGAQAGQAGVNGRTDHPATSPARTRPKVQPKPQGLHGNVLHSASSGPSPNRPAEDLAQRFAKLRATPAQDPRIRTQPIIPPNAAPSLAPADLQSPTRTKVGAIDGMPRLPDAIYNPARGTISSEAAELPSSAPRAMFTRTNSTTSISNVNKTPKTAPAEEYFVPAQTFTSTTTTANPTPSKRSKIMIPEGSTISAQDLVRYMKMGAKDVSILLIDIRSRELFEEGHIMSQATICLEPGVLMRPDISANDIADSNVLAPAGEMVLFENRHQFDLVVFYDQESDRIPVRRGTPEQKAISGLYNALTQYDFTGNATRKTLAPKLLEGGLEAWTSECGKAALQTSSTSTAGRLQTSAPMARSFLKRRQTYVARPVQDPEEAKRWEETLADMGPIRTTEDFLRRKPAMPTKQESMVTSPLASPTLDQPASPFHARMSHEENMYKNLPAPPTRPAPTLPRRSYSGLADSESGPSIGADKGTLKSGVEVQKRAHRVGLINPHVHCFANSTFQSVFATPGFSRDLATNEWVKTFEHPPKKSDETIPNPQFLIKMVSGLFNWMNLGTMSPVHPKILMNYIKYIHERRPSGEKKPDFEVFGGNSQQDAHEFFSFVMDNIHDETNVLRDRKSHEDKEYSESDGSLLANAIDYWREYCLANSSIVDKYFRGMDVLVNTCQRCHHEVRKFQSTNLWILHLPPTGDVTNLGELLKYRRQGEWISDSRCDKCKQIGRHHYIKFARLPDRLVITISRFQATATHDIYNAKKIGTKVRFPIRDLDLTDYCAVPDPEMKQSSDHHFAGRMRYDLYAVTVHQGANVTSGHYFSYVRNDLSLDPTSWYRCNDSIVTPVKIGSNSPDDQTENMFRDGSATAYMLFYRRQDH
ncbi:hypothetical protein B0T14DRAFT_538805 [Immersiella caudata]|uniref:ubiquitinyl hydrolase 1 n=1 Tax=Immersiella caudata TaxID=314043 RepID=A0AA40BXG4_9PEZI|nr:hypothetical protein B0T14DRAFT_538805 [Immersiella caudata]